MKVREREQHGRTKFLPHLMVLAACAFALTCLPAATANLSGTITAQAKSETATQVRKKAKTIISRKCTGNTVKSNLKKLFKYTEKNWKYAPTHVNFKSDSKSSTWTRDYALSIMKSKGGMCYHWAAGYAHLARQYLGSSSKYKVRVGVGSSDQFGNGLQTHAWVEIKIKGTWYVFDPEMDQVNAGSSQEYFYMKRSAKSTKKLYNSYKDENNKKAKYYTVKYIKK